MCGLAVKGQAEHDNRMEDDPTYAREYKRNKAKQREEDAILQRGKNIGRVEGGGENRLGYTI